MQNLSRQYRRDDLPTGVKVGRRGKFGEIKGYSACWCGMNGKKFQAYFGIREWYTLEAALASAISRRELEISNLMNLGAAYTKRHGL
jgi:hypothetical protein